MSDEPNMCFDIDALFAHMIENLSFDVADQMEWTFSLCSKDFGALKVVASHLPGEFTIALQEDVDTYVDGKWSKGLPLLSASITAALEPGVVKSYARRFEEIAHKHGVEYDGVGCFDAEDPSEFQWLDLESAGWRLRHYVDTGMAAGEDLPFAFCIMAASEDGVAKVEEAALQQGFEDVAEYDADGEYGLLVFVNGKNDEKILQARFDEMDAIAKGAGATLAGVEFFENEDDESESEV